MNNENIYLLLGCYGREENGFTLCSGIENKILKLDESLVNYDGIMNYLEIVHLFDKPMLEQSAIRHTIHNLQDKFDQKIKRLWTDHQYNLIERFMHMHKPCGFYCRLILNQEEDIDKEKETISFIIPGTIIQNKDKDINFKKVRNRKY